VSRARLFGQLLTESMLLAVLGGVAGLMVAHWGGAALRAGLLEKSEAPAGLRDPRTVLFATGAALVVGLLTGLAPVLQAGARKPHRRSQVGLARRYISPLENPHCPSRAAGNALGGAAGRGRPVRSEPAKRRAHATGLRRGARDARGPEHARREARQRHDHRSATATARDREDHSWPSRTRVSRSRCRSGPRGAWGSTSPVSIP
jgi:hypothetical protein